VPEALAALTTVVPYNDLAALAEAFRKHDDIATVIIEPVAGNMGCIPPLPGYLEGLRKLCSEHGALLIFDEVMTGFRVGAGSAMGHYQIKPDLVCFGKIIGGGLPLAAYGGRADVMAMLAPQGPVYQAGTLSGNPLATAAGCATLEQLDSRVYDQLETTGAALEQGLNALFKKHRVTACTTRVGGMFGVFFSATAPRNFTEVKASDTARFSTFFHGMLEHGVYLPPSAFEAWFLSSAHTPEMITQTLHAADLVLAQL